MLYLFKYPFATLSADKEPKERGKGKRRKYEPLRNSGIVFATCGRNLLSILSVSFQKAESERANESNQLFAEAPSSLLHRVAAILVEIDANDLNNVLACRHYIIFKIGDFLSFSMKFCHDLGRPNNYLMKLRGLQGDLFVW